MSLILKVDRFGAEPRYYPSRALLTQVGEDRNGVISFGRPFRNYFQVMQCENRYFMQSLSPELQLNGESLDESRIIPLTNGTRLTHSDTTFTVIVTSPESELLAHGEGICLEEAITGLDESRLPRIRIALVALSKTHILPEGFPVMIGSLDACPICLEFPGVQGCHLQAVFERGCVYFKSIDGAFEVVGSPQTSQPLEMIEVRQDSKIKLLPSNLELEIIFPVN